MFSKLEKLLTIYLHIISMKNIFCIFKICQLFVFPKKIKTISPNWLRILHKIINLGSLNVLKSYLIQTISFDLIGKIVFRVKNGVSHFIDLYAF